MIKLTCMIFFMHMHDYSVRLNKLNYPITLQNSTSKRTGQNPESIFQEAIYHGILARTSSRYLTIDKLQ